MWLNSIKLWCFLTLGSFVLPNFSVIINFIHKVSFWIFFHVGEFFDGRYSNVVGVIYISNLVVYGFSLVSLHRFILFVLHYWFENPVFVEFVSRYSLQTCVLSIFLNDNIMPEPVFNSIGFGDLQCRINKLTSLLIHYIMVTDKRITFICYGMDKVWLRHSFCDQSETNANFAFNDEVHLTYLLLFIINQSIII